MLVLSRKAGEKVQIGEEITITVVRIGPEAVRLGIEAPGELSILRTELLLRELATQQSAEAHVRHS